MTQYVLERPAPALSASTGISAEPPEGWSWRDSFEGGTLDPPSPSSRDVRSRNESMAARVLMASEEEEYRAYTEG